ncbi:dihydroorotase [Trichothermofontia sp.]
MASVLLQQVRLIDPIAASDRVVSSQENRVTDVLIADNILTQIGEDLTADPDIPRQNGQGLVLGPGLVDLYSHSGEPGFESRETLASLGRAAIAGGFTRLTLLPDTQPVLDQPAGWHWLQSTFRQLNLPLQLNSWGALTIAAQGQQMTEFADLVAAGVVGLADGQPLADPLLLWRILDYAQPLRKPIALWPCQPQLHRQGGAREGTDAIRLGLPRVPAIAESIAIATLLECVAATGTPVHLMRISTARGVDLIADAKARGLPITASTTWMHLLLSTADIDGTASFQPYDPGLHLAPPLGTPSDRAALIEAINTGVLDAIAIDHAPYTYEEKTVAFSESPPGAIGLELALPLLWHNLVTPGLVPATTLWYCLSTAPAHCLQQTPPALTLGQVAELTLFDPQQTWVVSPTTLASLATNTPWLGQTLTGRVVKTWAPTANPSE